MNQLKKYGPYIALLIVFFLWFQSCENQKAKISDLETIASLDSLDFKLQKDKLGNKIALQNKKIVSDRKTMRKLTSEVNGLRNINAQVKATVKTVIVKVEADPINDIEIKNEISKDSTKKLDHFLKLPQSFVYKSEWFKMQYSIDTLGTSLIDTAFFITKPVVSFGYKDEGLIKNVFKAPVPVVSYQDKNPFSNVQGLQNIEYKPKTKWYQRKIVWFASGAVAGILILK